MSKAESDPASLTAARAAYRMQMTKWGFIWALWCAVLFGLWYVPAAAVWYEVPFRHMRNDDPRQLLAMAAVISAFNALATVLFLGIWTGALGKLADFGRTVRRFRGVSKWFFLAGLVGGPLAHWGSYVAIGYVGPVFAAIASLMYPVFGALLARLWYHEKITWRAAIGIFVIVAGGVATYAPGVYSEVAGASHGAWIGYLGGIVCALGWGIEGAIVGRTLDVADSDIGVSARFLAEALYWFLIILPSLALFTDLPIRETLVATLHSPGALLWLLTAGIAYAFCYASWYKSFPLIGVGRGSAFSALYAVFAVIFLAMFTVDLPQWNFALGLLLAVVGAFVMFTERSEILEVIRVVRA